jgi:hypothetical protein
MNLQYQECYFSPHIVNREQHVQLYIFGKSFKGLFRQSSQIDTRSFSSVFKEIIKKKKKCFINLRKWSVSEVFYSSRQSAAGVYSLSPHIVNREHTAQHISENGKDFFVYLRKSIPGVSHLSLEIIFEKKVFYSSPQMVGIRSVLLISLNQYQECFIYQGQECFLYLRVYKINYMIIEKTSMNNVRDGHRIYIEVGVLNPSLRNWVSAVGAVSRISARHMIGRRASELHHLPAEEEPRYRSRVII